MLPRELEVDALLTKAGSGRELERRLALDALAGRDAQDVVRPALRALRRGETGTREVAARVLGRVGDVEAVRPLVTAAILDREALVRTAAVASLKQIAHPDTVMPFARAMWGEAAQVRMNAAEALGSIGGPMSVEWLVRRVSTSGGPGGRNNIFVGSQISYISDFDVEIAQASQVGDPIVGTIREGVCLDARVINAREEFTQVERRVFYAALSRATGKDHGEDAAAWKTWWEDEGRVAMAQAASR
jgi:hypothetical protein